MAVCPIHIQVATHRRTFTRTKMYAGIRRESVARAACNVHRLSIRGILQAETRRIENYFLHYLAHPRHRLCKLPDGFSNAEYRQILRENSYH